MGETTEWSASGRPRRDGRLRWWSVEKPAILPGDAAGAGGAPDADQLAEVGIKLAALPPADRRLRHARNARQFGLGGPENGSADVFHGAHGGMIRTCINSCQTAK